VVAGEPVVRCGRALVLHAAPAAEPGFVDAVTAGTLRLDSIRLRNATAR
jgi:hypothetical protein